MGYGGVWRMGYAIWGMVGYVWYRVCDMRYGGVWRMADGGWRMGRVARGDNGKYLGAGG